MSAFKGIKVLDVSQALAGPLSTMLLGDLGAEVIKIEPPGIGDHSRGFAPSWNGEGCTYLAFNRNKRSIVLDLKTKAGQEVALKLASEADVIVESFRTGTIDRLGLSYEAVSRVNPAIVYCSISAFGRTGPYADRAGYDLILQAHGGLLSVTGNPGEPSIRVGYSIVDIFAGMQAYGAITTALYQRKETGRGQFVESSLLEGIVQMMSYHGVGYQRIGELPQKHGPTHPNIVPSNVYQASDAEFVLAAATEKIWKMACEAMDLSELAVDPRFLSNELRVKNRDELDSLLQPALLSKTASEWVELFNAKGVPSAKLNTIPEVMECPQVQSRDMFVPIHHPDIPSLRVPGCPLKLSDAPPVFARHPPRLGEHTDEVLGEYGYTTAQIESLRAESVIA